MPIAEECAKICAAENHPLRKGFKRGGEVFAQYASFIGDKGATVAKKSCLHPASPGSGLRQRDRQAVKLAFNTVSIATLLLFGRLSGN